MIDAIRRFGAALYPARSSWRGAAVAVALSGLVALVYFGSQARTGLGTWTDIGLVAAVGLVLMLLVMLGTWLLLAMANLVPRWVMATMIAAVAAWYLLLELPLLFALIFALPIVVVHAILGGAMAACLRGRWGESSKAKRRMLAATISLVLLADAAFVAWLVWPGFAPHESSPVTAGTTIDATAAASAAQTGAFEVETLFYGSGEDLHRAEFAADVDVKTEPVDASPFVSVEGWRADLRDRYWGFGPDRFPRNGRVWYPVGEGPFPLVLIVHGNANMTEHSDAGYGYLGELLASRGFITASVDECFFGSYFLASGLNGENDGRGWMLLKHLELWREWNAHQDSPFFGRVDLDRVALVGHSRGGESAAHAAALNRLSYYPDDATVEFDFGFGIQAVVAIAPSDGQYEPSGRRTELADVSYLVLQGSHDADVSRFMGMMQYRRTTFTQNGPWFKAFVFAERANHGQFNTVWGRIDSGWPIGHLLNTRPLLAADQQRRIATLYIPAFLEATLHGADEYRPLFRDHRTVADQLPDTLYVTGYRDPKFVVIADFEEDIDVTTTTLDGGSIATSGLTSWGEENMIQRDGGSQRNQAVRLGWGEEEEEESTAQSTGDPNSPEEAAASDARFEITLPGEPGLTSDKTHTLVMSLMDVTENEERTEPLDFTVELEDTSGAVASLPLSHFRTLELPIETVFTKLPALERLSEPYARAIDYVLQRFELPLAEFGAESEAFDPESLAKIRLRFDRTEQGAILLDDVGIWPGA